MEMLMDPGLALSAVEYAIKILQNVKHMVDNQHQNSSQYQQLLVRFRSIQTSLIYIKNNAQIDFKSPIWGSAFTRIKTHFEDALRELRTVRDSLRGHTLAQYFHASQIRDRLHSLNHNLDELQRDLDVLGFFTMSNVAASQQSTLTVHNIHDVQHSLTAMHQQLTALVSDVKQISQQNTTRSISTARDVQVETPALNSLLSAHHSEQLRPDSRHPHVLLQDVVHTHLKLQTQVPKLLRNNFSESQKALILDKFEAICSRWRLHPNQITVFASHTVGHDWNHDTYNGTVTLRDLHQNIIRTAHVLVKNVTVGDFANVKPLTFLKELVLLRELSHPCLTQFYGATWPDECFEHPQAATVSQGRAMIVTERMTHTVPSVIRQRILKSERKRLHVLRDVASAVEYLHSRGLFNLDLNPANVLLRIAKGQILGRAKLNCLSLGKSIVEFAQHYNAQPNGQLVGAKLFEQPRSTTETLASESTSDAQTSTAAMNSRDAFRFGVLMCFMLSNTHTPFGRSNHLQQMLSPSSDSRRTVPLSFWTNGIENSFLRNLADLCFSEDESCRPSFQFIHLSLQKYINGEQLADFSKGVSSKTLYLNGRNSLHGRNGWAKDANLARIFFEHAASMGHIPSTFQLGHYYVRGKGGLYDVEKGVQRYIEAANAGYSKAQHHLGDCYYHGNGVKRNIALAMELYRRAASQGHSLAQKKLDRHSDRSSLGSDVSVGKSMASWSSHSSMGDIGDMFQRLQSKQDAMVQGAFGSGKFGGAGMPGMAGTVFKSLAGGSSIAINALNGLEHFYANL